MTEKTASAPVESTPEFQSALAEMKANMQAEMVAMRTAIIDELAAHVKTQPAIAGDATGLLSELAMRIAEISDQGNSDRKRIDPRILAEREAAMNKMGELILASKNLPGDQQPIYFLIAKTFLRDRLIEPFSRSPNKNIVRTEIRWIGAPNSAMRPKNDSAKNIYRQFVKWIGGSEAINGQVKIPQWATEKGTILVNPPGASAAQHIPLPEPVPYDFDEPISPTGNGAVEEEQDPEFKVLSQQDPTAPEIRVLGTVAPPARRMDPAERRA